MVEGIGTTERLLRADVTREESKKIEKILRKNNISYFEKWKNHRGPFKFLYKSDNSKCDLYIHMDSYEKAKQVLGEKD